MFPDKEDQKLLASVLSGIFEKVCAASIIYFLFKNEGFYQSSASIGISLFLCLLFKIWSK